MIDFVMVLIVSTLHSLHDAAYEATLRTAGRTAQLNVVFL